MTRAMRCLGLMFLIVLAACGRSATGGNPDSDPTDLPDDGGTNGGGTGGGGTGGGGTNSGCVDDSTCTGNTYCHFPSMSTWIPGTRGTCESPCTGDNSCDIGQRCFEGTCYSNLSCDPALGHTQCAPGEVCNAQTHICGAPPRQCSFQDQCPTGWLCEAGGRCTPPSDLNFGSCQRDTDCSTVASCGGSACWCRSNSCVPKQCLQPSDCGVGNNCSQGYCRPTTPCQSHSQCIASNLICERGYCVQPDSCENGVACAAGFTCNTNLRPDLCLPGSSNQCNRDEQCGVGEYCDLFSGRCTTGCRNDADCTGKCGNNRACFCGNNRECSSNTPSQPGQTCGSQGQCQSGTACAPNDPLDPLCAIDAIIGGGIPGLPDLPNINLCQRNCRPVCDLLVSLIVNPCAEGEMCQPPSENLIAMIIELINGGDNFDPTKSTVGFCYPPPNL